MQNRGRKINPFKGIISLRDQQKLRRIAKELETTMEDLIKCAVKSWIRQDELEFRPVEPKKKPKDLMRKDFLDLRKLIKRHNSPELKLCAIADENGNTICKKKENEWQGITDHNERMVTCPECRKILGYK